MTLAVVSHTTHLKSKLKKLLFPTQQCAVYLEMYSLMAMLATGIMGMAALVDNQ